MNLVPLGDYATDHRLIEWHVTHAVFLDDGHYVRVTYGPSLGTFTVRRDGVPEGAFHLNATDALSSVLGEATAPKAPKEGT